MESQLLFEFLLWSLAINYGFLLIWFGIFVGAHDVIYRLHSHWFRLSPEGFDALHYEGMAIYKIAIVMFNMVPAIALAILT